MRPGMAPLVSARGIVQYVFIAGALHEARHGPSRQC